MPGHTHREKENSEGKSLKSSASRAVLVKSETPEAWKGKTNYLYNLTAMLASLDHFYEIYGASCWNGRLQNLQFHIYLIVSTT